MNELLYKLQTNSAEYFIPLLTAIFCISLLFKIFTYYIRKRMTNFAKEFETRVQRHLNEEYSETHNLKFAALVSSIFDRTFTEIYQIRDKYKRRRLDRSLSILDSYFFIKEGMQLFTFEINNKLMFCNSNSLPNFYRLVHYTLNANKFLSSLWWPLFKISATERIIQKMPKFLILVGFFGTFMGMTSPIHQIIFLSPANVVWPTIPLRPMLEQLILALNSSIAGILLGAIHGLINLAFSDKGKVLHIVETFVTSIDALWYESQNTRLKELKISNNQDEYQIYKESLNQKQTERPGYEREDNMRVEKEKSDTQVDYPSLGNESLPLSEINKFRERNQKKRQGQLKLESAENGHEEASFTEMAESEIKDHLIHGDEDQVSSPLTSAYSQQQLDRRLVEARIIASEIDDNNSQTGDFSSDNSMGTANFPNVLIGDKVGTKTAILVEEETDTNLPPLPMLEKNAKAK
jgi:hypothetical protein